MKRIYGDMNRGLNSKVLYESKDFCFELTPDWGNLPANLRYTPTPSACCDKDDNVYLVTRDYDHPIVVLNAEGDYVRSLGKGLFVFTHAIYVSKQNTLLCVDCNYHVVRELTMDGEHIRDFGNFGKPSDSGYDAGVWRRRQMEGDLIPMDILYNDKWAFMESIRTIKRAAPPFNRPTSVAQNSKGEYFFTDGYSNVAVHKFSAQGELIKTWGGLGTEPGKFLVPHGIWIDKLDRVWVADREGNSVQVFDEEGTCLAYVSKGLFQPSEIWSDDEFIYVGERGGLTVFNMDMEIVAQIGYYLSNLMLHGVCGNSKSELFLIPLVKDNPHVLMKMKRVN